MADDVFNDEIFNEEEEFEKEESTAPWTLMLVLSAVLLLLAIILGMKELQDFYL